MRTIFITTGDVDGIGLEVATKALRELRPRPNERIILIRGQGKANDQMVGRIRGWKVFRASKFSSALDDAPAANLIDLSLASSPVEWFEEAVSFCLRHPDAGVVTGPLSKTAIQKSGRVDVGHTEILARLCGCHVLQGYLGTKFHVLLATAHTPVKNVSLQLTHEALERALLAAKQLRALLPGAAADRPIGLLGLNPHAGEGGLIGDEEGAWPELVRRHLPSVQGPLVPDAAFRRENWRKYSVYVACYHDQGLIPFKMIHGSAAGAQVSLGIPFVRTSVDHGTAKDLFGLNKADSGSMLDAIKWCRRLMSARK